MSLLKLYFLGPPRLELNGKLVEPDTRKAIALVAYLALTGERYDRDALAALLWPELDGSRARAALWRTLSALKAAVGEAPLYATRTVIGLNPEATWCDVLAFRDLLEGDPSDGELEQAVDLYRDDFLAGFSLRDSLSFDDWQLLEAQNLRRGLENALEKLTRDGLTRGQIARSLPFARRWLQLDPLREEAHRQLMRLYAADNRRDAALRQYRECVRVLEEELGVAPLPETTDLYEAIQENRLAAPPPPPPAPTSPAAAARPSIPLVGRGRELTDLRENYRQVGPDGRLLVVSGEIGIGKTRLVEAFLQELAPVRLLAARCYEGEQNLAYAPFLQGLTAALQQPDAAGRLAAVDPLWLAEAARLVPALADFAGELPPAAADGPGAQSRFFEGIFQVVAALLAGDEPGVFWVDDAHWADAASLDLLAYLTRRLEGQPYGILLTKSDQEQPAAGRLERLIHEARLDGRAALISLARLSEADVGELLHAGAAPIDLAPRLFRETEGLPSFITAYLADQGELAATGEWTLPHSVRDLLRARLAGVDEAGRQLLQTAAAIGRDFDVDLLQKASGRGEEEVISGLEALLNRRLLVEQESQPTFVFSHDKLRQMVYDETRLIRRRLLHRRLAQALKEPSHRWRGQVLEGQIAHHLQLAGQEDEAAAYYKLAGDHARLLYANREALAHYEAALALGHPDPAALHEACADLHTLAGDYTAARSGFEMAASIAAAADDPAVLGRVEHKLGQVYLRQGEWTLAERQLHRAGALYEAAGAVARRATLLGDLSYAAYRQEALAPARELARQARELAETAGSPLVLAQIQNILGILARRQEELDEAVQVLEEGRRLAEEAGHLPVQVASLNNLALTEMAACRYEPALAHLQTALRLCETYGDRHYQAALHNNLADLYHLSGREDEAMAHLMEAVTLYAEVGRQEDAWQPEIWKLSEW